VTNEQDTRMPMNCVVGRVPYNPPPQTEGSWDEWSLEMSKLLGRTRCILLAVAMAGCRQYDVKIAPFNPRMAQQQERLAAKDAPLQPLRPLPTTLQSPFPDEPGEATTAPTQPSVPPATGPAIGINEAVVRMPLRELVHRAATNSLDVKVAAYTPAIDETRVLEAEARFDPVLFTNIQYSLDRILAPTPENPGISPGLGVTSFRTYTGQLGVRQDLESGGRVELRYEPRHTRRSAFDQPGAVNPFWTSELALQITQPLLRDFGTDVNRARIVINRNNQRISLLDFRDALEKNISDLERAYWQLVQAEGEVRIFEELLQRTLRTGEILHQRMRIGQDVGRVQMSQANSSIEQRRTALIRARARVRDLSDQIKRLVNDPELPVTSNILILTADAPLEEQIRFNLEDQINTAMENRFELGQQQMRARNAAVAASVAKNNLLPQLNLVGQVSTQGLDSSLDGAIRDQGTDHLDYTIGLQLEIPIGNRAARAIWKRAQLQRLQAIDQYRALVEEVSFNVKIAAREVETTWETIVGTRHARFTAADALAAVEEREQNNSEQLTPEFVNRKLDLQAQLAETQRAEATAMSDYQIAISNLERSKGTLLRYNNIIMEEAPRVDMVRNGVRP
jgi:outer membrane protein